MFPHKKLDWTIGRLERDLADRPADNDLRNELARACLSLALYHSGGESWCNKALTHARKVLADDPADLEALVTAGSALVGVGRPDAARRFLDQAMSLDPKRADLHLAYGALHRSEGDRHMAVRHLETACRQAPKAWETHLFLGRALSERSRELSGKQRLIERAQYHLIQAMQLEPSPDLSAPLLRDLGVSCIQTGRYREAEKFFVRLREHEAYRSSARFHLGLVAYQLGKYKNAITHFRQYAQDCQDDPRVHTRMALSYLQLGDTQHARESAGQALLANSDDILARYTMGCAWLEEGKPSEAISVFRETLQEHPDHMPSYIELARTRRAAKDVQWMVQALIAEVGQYDRLPLASGDKTPRSVARQRIEVLLDELRALGPSSIAHVLPVLQLVQDEGIRFRIWETACSMSTSAAADEVSVRLREPGKHFGVGLGLQAFAAAMAIPEQVLTRGLVIEEEDLKKAAVDRMGPASDVDTHRGNVETQRNEARSYQALLLLAIASRRSRAGRRLLEEWARTADPDLAVAARAGLGMYGDPNAVASLEARAQQEAAAGRVQSLLSQVAPPKSKEAPRPVIDDEEVHCTTCGRTARDAAHLMSGTHAVICDVCVISISQHRRDQVAPDDAGCSFCGRSHLETSGLYKNQDIVICANCLELSLGLMERQEVDRFLAAY
ncbi:MAG: tetratricopeptide repeat protein [Myxococcota bacterium]|nr:tetratricopeptide repeat protein [Myxococcota bacterium]